VSGISIDFLSLPCPILIRESLGFHFNIDLGAVGGFANYLFLKNLSPIVSSSIDSYLKLATTV